MYRHGEPDCCAETAQLLGPIRQRTWLMDSTLRPDVTARFTNSTRGVPVSCSLGSAGSPAHWRMCCTQPWMTLPSSLRMPSYFLRSA